MFLKTNTFRKKAITHRSHDYEYNVLPEHALK